MVVRHSFGFVLGVVLTPVLAYGAGWGYVRAGASFNAFDDTISDHTRMYGAFALLAAVGLVMGIVILARWASPFVSLVPALVFLGWTLYFLISPRSALNLPNHLPPAGDLRIGLRMLLGYGVFAMMGAALLVTTWAPRRWSRDDGGPHSTESRTGVIGTY